MKKFFLIIFMTSLLVPAINWGQKPTAPQKANVSLEKVLTLGHGEVMFQSIASICEDHEENIYVLDRKACKVHKFSNSGKRLLSFGERGQGPGEFGHPHHIATTPDQKIVVSEDMAFVSFFHRDGRFIERIKVQKGLDLTYITPNLFYAWQWTKKGSQQILVDKQGQIVKRIFEKHNQDFSVSHPDETGRLVRTNYSALEYSPHFVSNHNRGRSILAMTNNYKLLLVNKKGEVEREISREIKPLAISGVEKKIFTTRIQGQSKMPDLIKKEFIKKIPKFKNYFDRVLLGDRYIFVFHIKEDISKDGEEIPVDVFNYEGEFLCSTNLVQKPVLITDKYAYSVKEEGEDILLVKYRISL